MSLIDLCQLEEDLMIVDTFQTNIIRPNSQIQENSESLEMIEEISIHSNDDYNYQQNRESFRIDFQIDTALQNLEEFKKVTNDQEQKEQRERKRLLGKKKKKVENPTKAIVQKKEIKQNNDKGENIFIDTTSFSSLSTNSMNDEENNKNTEKILRPPKKIYRDQMVKLTSKHANYIKLNCLPKENTITDLCAKVIEEIQDINFKFESAIVHVRENLEEFLKQVKDIYANYEFRTNPFRNNISSIGPIQDLPSDLNGDSITKIQQSSKQRLDTIWTSILTLKEQIQGISQSSKSQYRPQGNVQKNTKNDKLQSEIMNQYQLNNHYDKILGQYSDDLLFLKREIQGFIDVIWVYKNETNTVFKVLETLKKDYNTFIIQKDRIILDNEVFLVSKGSLRRIQTIQIPFEMKDGVSLGDNYLAYSTEFQLIFYNFQNDGSYQRTKIDYDSQIFQEGFPILMKQNNFMKGEFFYLCSEAKNQLSYAKFDIKKNQIEIQQILLKNKKIIDYKVLTNERIAILYEDSQIIFMNYVTQSHYFDYRKINFPQRSLFLPPNFDEINNPIIITQQQQNLLIENIVNCHYGLIQKSELFQVQGIFCQNDGKYYLLSNKNNKESYMLQINIY